MAVFILLPAVLVYLYRVSGAGSLIYFFHFRLPEFFLMFHRYIFSLYSLFTSQKVSVVISSISQDITEKYHWNTIFFSKKWKAAVDNFLLSVALSLRYY